LKGKKKGSRSACDCECGAVSRRGKRLERERESGTESVRPQKNSFSAFLVWYRQ